MSAFKDRTGETRTMGNGLYATITAYRGARDMDIQFENGAIRYGVPYRYFKTGNIRCPMLIRHIGNYAHITNPNTQPNAVFLMDIEDLPLIHGGYCGIDSGGYIRVSIHGGDRQDRLHRAIMGFPECDVDHKDGNKMDLRKQNLRLCTKSENAYNKGANSRNTSGYKGVHWHNGARKWRCQIKKESISYHLGYFVNPTEAAKAYNAKAIELYGEYARLYIIEWGVNQCR